jgi:hypothetical protein
MDLRDILARRPDLSTFLVHLCRSTESRTAKEALISIIESQTVLARTMFGQAKSFLESRGLDLESQHCVCFTETPLEHLHLLTADIDGRSFRFEPYGLAITKKQGRERGVNPVWYVDITPGHKWLTQHLNSLLERGFDRDHFSDSAVEAILPFIEQMGSGTGTAGRAYRKEFWWEREWRHRGDFLVPWPYLGLCPEAEIPELRQVAEAQDIDIRFIDPSWSLEQIIARLAKFPPGAVDIL